MRDTAATALEESASACPHSRRGLTPLGRRQKYPKIHVSTGEESSGSGPEFTQGLRPRHQRERNSERPPRNSHGDWPFLRPPERVPEGPVGKNSRRSRRISRGGALHRKGERNSRVVPPFQESPGCVSPFQRNLFSLHCLDVQAEDRLPPRVHVGQPCGKASWESPVGKTRGKTIDALIHGADCVTLLLPLWRKAQVHARIRDEDRLPWGDARSTPRSMSALERNPQVPALSSHKVLGPGISGRGIPKGPRGTRMGTGLS
ncbi:hypothetical protein MJG53_016552 [Ovis ammon polii x Ovis aries]|uniref:Uncharacterized protein n=1 Tax=Ovis ammon polii x Ovis aries TaxID=2918886 RepID=A0ACB9U938_9CETA|nr:hypothetical protein MJG53_016552 [Ovis ammon polii x Ovis aries]